MAVANPQDEKSIYTRSSTYPNVMNRNVPGSVMMDRDRIDQIPWYEGPHLPGLKIKYLWIDINAGMSASIFRISKGVQLPVHAHYSTVWLYCHSGSFTYEAGTIGPGGFGYEPFGVIHEPDVTVAEETEMFLLGSSHNRIQLYEEDGTPGISFTTRETLKGIRESCGEAGVAHLNLPTWFWQD